MPTIRLRLSRPHPAQKQVLAESKRFNVVVGGRRLGKSRFGIRLGADTALAGHPVGWFSPTYKMLAELWREMVATLKPVTRAKSEQEHRLELITGGTIDMWSLENPDAVRGRRYARVIVDEAAMVRELGDVWNLVIRSTLIDYQGDAYFLSTPKGRNFFAEMYEWGQSGDYPDWASWRFPSMANPYLPAAELAALRNTMTMTARAYEQEIEARFIDEVSGALWKLAQLDANRVREHPDLARVVVAIDPAVSSNPDSDETGIIAAGVTAGENAHGYVLGDASGTYSPDAWARKAVELYRSLQADYIVAEANQGGDMVRFTLRTVDPHVPVKLVHASRGKQTRAEPVVALDEQARIHHVGTFPELELQMTTWSPVDDKDSPDRVDARVWALTELMVARKQKRRVRVA